MRVYVGQDNQTPFCNSYIFRYKFDKLPASLLDVDIRLQSLLLSFPSILVGKLTVITLQPGLEAQVQAQVPDDNLSSSLQISRTETDGFLATQPVLCGLGDGSSHITHTGDYPWKELPNISKKTLVSFLMYFLPTLVLATHS